VFDTVIGLDCSLTDTGIVRLDRTKDGWVPSFFCSTSEFKNDKDPLRQYEIIQKICSVISSARNAGRDFAVVIEDYAFASNVGKMFSRAELVGAVKYICLTYYGVETYLVAPTALKRFMGCADKKGDKDAMGKAACSKFGFENTNNNIVDAFCLARYLVANKEGQLLSLVCHSPLLNMGLMQEPAPETKIKKRLKILIPKRLTKNLSGSNLKTATLKHVSVHHSQRG